MDGMHGRGLGWLSAKYEGKVGSANKDIDQNGNPAGWAYGKYQFNSAKGGLSKFFADNPEYAAKFKGLKPETTAFKARWQQLAKDDPKGFESAQDKSAANLWYKPAQAAYSKAGFDLKNEGVREAIFSSSIQHGGVVRKLLPLLQKNAKKDISRMSPEEQIRLIYKGRAQYHPRGNSRYQNEMKSALGVAGSFDNMKGILPTGARAQMALGGNMSSSNSSNHVDTTIGDIHIHTQATDAAGIASSIKPALENTLAFNTYSVDTGMS
jgi:hypothetical protein